MNIPILARDARIDERQITEGSKLTESPSRIEASQTKLLSVALAAIIFALGALLMSGMAEAAGAGCVGVQISPGADLAQVAAARPAGTTFCIKDGAYNITSRIVAQDGDSFVGVYSDSSRPSISTTKADHIIYTSGADNVIIRGLRVSGAVHSDSCEPGCGRGIGEGGENLTVIDVRATGNENQGIGGTGRGLLVKNSELDHNGSIDSAADGGKVSAAGLKTVSSFSVQNSYIHDNYWSGVWCDVECDSASVTGSRVVDNGKAGVHIEISKAGQKNISNNIIKRNGLGNLAWPAGAYPTARLGGVLLVGSSRIDVDSNAFGGNMENAVEVAPDTRTGGTVSEITIHDNTLNGDTLKGCSVYGVLCSNNH
jgi:hypothetical protein